MNRQSIHQQIESLLKIIQEQHNQIRQQQSIPQVEIDFMIQNLRQLYEASLLLNHTNALSYLDEVKAAMTQKIIAEKRAIELSQKESQPEPKKEIMEEPVILQKVEITEHIQTEQTVSVSREEISVTTVIEEKSKEKVSKVRKSDLNSSLFEDKPTLGDKFGNGESLHLKIASQSASKTVADKLHHKPIKDLKAAIGINEKFLFINQLFEGNLQSYSEAIEKINSLSNFESAKQFITTELTSFNYDDKNEHVRTFMELVSRRFI